MLPRGRPEAVAGAVFWDEVGTGGRVLGRRGAVGGAVFCDGVGAGAVVFAGAGAGTVLGGEDRGGEALGGGEDRGGEARGVVVCDWPFGTACFLVMSLSGMMLQTRLWEVAVKREEELMIKVIVSQHNWWDGKAERFEVKVERGVLYTTQMSSPRLCWDLILEQSMA